MSEQPTTGGLVFVGDAHIGNHARLGGARDSGLNVRCREHAAALGAAVEIANRRKAPLFQAGDLVDKPSSSPQVLAAALGELTKCHAGAVVCLGNHDRTSSAPMDHGLAPLAYAESVDIVEAPRIVEAAGIRVAVLPYSPANERGWLVEQAEELDDVADIVLAHCGVEHPRTSRHLSGGVDSASIADIRTACRVLGARGGFFGHHHHEFADFTPGLPFVVQIGALVPLGWSEVGSSFGKVWWLPNRLAHPSWERVDGPRFHRMGYSPGRMAAALSRCSGAPARVEVLCLEGEEDSADDEIAAVDLPDVQAFVVTSTEAAEEAAADAAQATVAADADGLRAFVAAADIPPDVDREEVLAAVEVYLGASA